MINIKYDMDNMTLFAYGHAGFAEKGKDIVCAAVSTLIFTLINSAPCIYDDEENVYIRMLRKKDRAIFETILKGLSLLAISYPENITLNTVPFRRKSEGDIINTQSRVNRRKETI